MTASDDQAKLLKRVLRISRFNGWTVTIIAGVFALLSLVTLEFAGVVVGLGVTWAGVVEILGHRRLADGRPGARALMVGSQLWLVVCVLMYCTWRLVAFDPDNPLAILGESQLVESLAGSGGLPIPALENLVTMVYLLMYRLVAALTLIFQGGLGLYYWLRVGRLEAGPGSTAPAP